MVSQILNFGLPAPIDMQVAGPNVDASRQFATNLLNQLRHVPGAADLRIQQAFDQPKFHITVDRTKAAEGGFTQRDIANNLLVSLSGSFQTTPSFWLNPKNASQLQPGDPNAAIPRAALHDIENIPITGAGAQQAEILADLASIQRDAGAGRAVALQRAARRGYLRLRARPRPRRGRARSGAHRKLATARIFRRHAHLRARPIGDHARFVQQPAGRSGSSPSCWCTC